MTQPEQENVLDVERLARALRAANAAAIPDTPEWRERLREQAEAIAEAYAKGES